MTSVERAKRFLGNKTRALALAAVPLATLVVVTAPAANAGVIFSNASPGWQAYSGDAVMNPGSIANAIISPGGETITGSGSGSATMGSDGVIEFDLFSDYTYDGIGGVFYHVDATITPQEGWSSSDWGIGFSDLSSPWGAGVTGVANTIPIHVIRSGYIDGSVITQGSGQQFAKFLVDNFFIDGLSTNVLTVDVNDFTLTSAPEPASFLTAIPAVAWMIVRRRRRRTSL